MPNIICKFNIFFSNHRSNQQNQNCSNQCVDSIALLVGGSDLAGWRSDMELFGPEGFIDATKMAEFPYKIDAPVGWWGKGRVKVYVKQGSDLSIQKSVVMTASIHQNVYSLASWCK